MTSVVFLIIPSLVLSVQEPALQAPARGAEPRPEAPSALGPTYRFGDYDADGLADVYAVRPHLQDKLFRNQGDGTFVDVTARVGLAHITGTRAALWQDFDRDGRLDLFVSAAPSADASSRLFQNTVAGFVDVTASSNLAGRIFDELFAQWLDFDLDGLSDLHVVTEHGDRLFRNLGTGSFEPVALPTDVRVDRVWIAPDALAGFVDGMQPRTGEPSPPAGTASAVLVLPVGPPTAFPATSNCARSVIDQATSNCLQASTLPSIGSLYPLSSDLNVNGSGNVGIGTASPGQKLDVVGHVRTSGQVKSTVATGTAPLEVSSTTLVTNLNADRVDGFEASAFSQLGSSIESSEITDATIANVDVSASAAIAGTKIAPNFGSQSILTTGALNVAGLETVIGVDSVSVIGGAAGNSAFASVEGATIAGGGTPDNFELHSITDDFGTIGGGANNVAGDELGTLTDAAYCTVAGGYSNKANATGATVGGGDTNHAFGAKATVAGGDHNQATGASAAVVGGDDNVASGIQSFVGGGRENVASGETSTIAGGYLNKATGLSSFAAGHRAEAITVGTFVWADESGETPFASTADDQFLIRAGGGVGIGTNAPEGPLHVFEGSAGTVTASSNASAVLERSSHNYVVLLAPTANEAGVLFGNPNNGADGGVVYDGSTQQLDFRTGGNNTQMSIEGNGNVGINRVAATNNLEVEGTASKTAAGDWLANSDRRIKTEIRDVTAALDTLDRVRPVVFRYTSEYRALHPSLEDKDYYNVVAQEFADVFPEYVKPSGEGDILQVDTYPMQVCAVAAVKELHALVRERDQEIASIWTRLAEREDEVVELAGTIRSQNDRIAALEALMTKLMSTAAARGSSETR